MIFSRQWLARYVELPSSIDELSERLTQAGFAVEGLEAAGDDVLLDIEVTTNRSDCMCHFGLAREIALLFERLLEAPHTAPDGAASGSVASTTGAPESGAADAAASDAEMTDAQAADDAPPDAGATDGAETAEAVRVEVESWRDCPRYVARVVRGVRIGPSPAWLVEQLESVGLRAVNNVVDVTNFVLWELGQPLHAFDLSRLAGAEIRVRRARPGETLVTLDGAEQKLDAETLVIADRERPVALAGILGGEDSEVSRTTTDILIESAHFAPDVVRKGAKRLGLHTDASHRFERGADPEVCLDAATRAAELICELTGGRLAASAVDARSPEWNWRLTGELSLSRLRAFAGAEIEATDVERWLDGLGFTVDRVAREGWQVEVPSWRYYDFLPARPAGAGAVAGDRAAAGEAVAAAGGQANGDTAAAADRATPDAAGEPSSADGPQVYPADLYEEILRLYGFDNIPATLPAVGGPDAGSCPSWKRRERIRDQLVASGFAEAVTYAFYAPQADARFPTRGRAIELANPLSELYSVLRRSLLPGLVDSAVFNVRRGAGAVRLYEIGHRFGEGEDGSWETEAVALVAGGTLGRPWDGPRDLDLFHLKGAVETVAAAFSVELAFRPAELAGFVAGTAAEMVVAGGLERVVGYLGIVEDADTRLELAAAELDVSALGEVPRAPTVRAASRFPGIEVDLTLTHALAVSWADLAATIEAATVADLEAYGLKDRYLGKGVPQGAVNSTIFFRYNAMDHSLTQQEVNERHATLTALLTERCGWKG